VAAPGWYPDPESMSRERFWDGGAWTAQVRDTGTQVRPAMPAGPDGPPTPDQAAPTVVGRDPVRPPADPSDPDAPFRPFNPSAPLPDLEALDAREAAERTRMPGPPPGGAPPAARARYVAPGTPAGPTRGRRTGLLVGLLVLAILVVGGGLAAFLLLGGDDDETATDPDPSTAPTAPSASPRRADLCDSGDSLAKERQPDDGRVLGGGLSFEPPPGYDYSKGLSFEYGFTLAPRAVDKPIRGGYTSTYAVASLDRRDFGTLEQAATSAAECYASGDFYLDPLPTYVPGDTETLTVDGRDAVSAGGELQLVDEPIPGGDVQVIVVDTGDPETFGVFVGDQILGDADLLAEREQVVSGLRVE